MVDLDPVVDQADIDELHDMISKHTKYTGSTVGQRILDNWNDFLPKFVKVMPRDYKRVLADKAADQQGQQEELVGASDG
jgi:glutamate synthase domain-containing protein 3